MLVNNSHKNYGDDFKKLNFEVKKLITLIEYKAENSTKKRDKVDFPIEEEYEYIKLLSDGLLSLREKNDFEASKLAIYKGLPIATKFLQRLNKTLKSDKTGQYSRLTNAMDYYYSIMSVGARYSLHYFIEYMFHNKSKKPYVDRRELLAPAVFYIGRGLLNQLHLGIKFDDDIVPPKKIVFSTFPSSGKTLCANYGMAWIKCLAMIKIRGGGMLRIGNEEGNVAVNSQSIKDVIADDTILDIFPEMACMRDINGKYYPFDKDSIAEWYLKEDLEEPRRASFRTSGSATNGIRINIALVIDDPSRGMVDRNNVEIHNKIIASYNGDWLSRFDNEEESFALLIGTRFNNFDVFSSVQSYAEKLGLIEDPRFKNTLKTTDGEIVIINIDCEDENGESAYPKLISTKTLQAKRESLTRQEYSCIYRQKPIPEEGLDFDYSILKTYDKPYLDNQLGETAVGSIDPTRKTGADFLSFPILKKIIDESDPHFGKYAFVGCVFRKRSIKDNDTFSLVLNTLMGNGVRKLYLEVNTDTSLGQRIKDHISKVNYGLQIKEIYNTIRKSQRIADQTQNIINNVVFPKEGLYSKSTDIGMFMENLTTYSSQFAVKHEDAADSLAMLSKEEFDITQAKNTVRFSSQPLL